MSYQKVIIEGNLGKDPELMALCAKSGCIGLLIGFETLSRENLIDCNKKFNSPESYSALIQALHSYNISVMGTFVFGNDHDSRESFEEITQFVVDQKIDLPRFSILTPFPGTGLFHRLESEERITSRDWSLYDGQHVVFRPKCLSAEDLLSGHERVWRDVYSYRAMRKRFRPKARPGK